ncbi:YxeA family protein [Erysipelothrix sp. HDW6C]|uniref:YxeA family protein n=1 Tax=Erysipelothrix sp. HDW6C TaxID=2714930 RepID=UPI0014092F83|nr:YxeA family protein [Erysipelothrix sp. HDW6C]QIK69486.1 YxeA family protein [Erysipelothrix sp. HDW6C]
MKRTKIMVGVAFVAVLAVVAFPAYQYYQNRYVGSEYFARVPLDFNTEPVAITDDRGAFFANGVSYQLDGYNEKGEHRVLEFTVYGDKASEMYEPGAYLSISASKQIVVGQSEVKDTDIPPTVLVKIR